jgi:polyhydroxyalkanoate synthase
MAALDSAQGSGVVAAQTVGGAQYIAAPATAAPPLDIGRARAHATTTARAAASFGAELARIAVGRSTVELPRQDHRFDDPAWREHPAYRRLAQGYLVWEAALNDVVENVDG